MKFLSQIENVKGPSRRPDIFNSTVLITATAWLLRCWLPSSKFCFCVCLFLVFYSMTWNQRPVKGSEAIGKVVSQRLISNFSHNLFYRESKGSSGTSINQLHGYECSRTSLNRLQSIAPHIFVDLFSIYCET